VRWAGWECVTLAGDLIRWYRATWYAFPDAAAIVLVGLLLAPVVIGFAMYAGMIPASALVGATLRFAVVYVAFAMLTAVPRGRARIRRRIRDAVQAVVGKTTPVGRARRCRWHGQHLQRADVIPPATWRDGRDTRRADLAEQIAWRLQDGGAFVVTWLIDRGRPVARVHRAAVLPSSLPARAWMPPAGVALIGATEPNSPGSVVVDGLSFAAWSWRHDPHLLMAGSTGAGKTAAQRWLTRALVATTRTSGRRMQLVGIDGKGAGSLAYLHNRLDVIGVGDEPAEWVDLIRQVQAEMNRRYAAMRAWRRGDTERRPYLEHDIGIVVDELVDIRDTAGDTFMEPFAQVVRLGREAGIHVASSVLRPDVTDSLPGLIRASHSARLMLGTLHDETTAKMLFTTRWRAALAASTDDDGSIAGRGIAMVAGRIYRVQIPWVPDPADDPASSGWLPPRPDPDPEPDDPIGAEPYQTADVLPLTTKTPRRRTPVPGPRQAS
jgi:hypothetical protein